MRVGFAARLAGLPLALALSLAPMAHAQDVAAGDPVAGKLVFQQKCVVCHTLVPGRRGVGPSLIGVFGKPSGTNDPTYSYSDAMKNSGKTWDAATLSAYLLMPRSYIPGVKMLFVGMPDPTDRANLIAFLATLK